MFITHPLQINLLAEKHRISGNMLLFLFFLKYVDQHLKQSMRLFIKLCDFFCFISQINSFIDLEIAEAMLSQEKCQSQANIKYLYISE